MSDVTVLIPTVGRVRHLEKCLDALRRGTHIPQDVVVVAQGAHAEVASLADAFSDLPLRVLRDDGRGRGRALNIGLRSIGDGVVLITDDDCRVRADWVDRGRHEVLSRANTLVTGRVLAHGDSSHVPALRLDPVARDYVGHTGFGKLTGGNMGARLADLMRLGGFDEGIVPAAEDNDLSWRWLRSGGALRYQPEMVIWHDDWRDDDEMRAVYRGYGKGQGRFYAKHLARGDLCIALFASRDLLVGGRMAVRALATGRPLAGELNLAFFPALVGALVRTPWLWSALNATLPFASRVSRRQIYPAAEALRGSVALMAVTDSASSATLGNDASRSPRPWTTDGGGHLPVVITTKDRRAQVIEAVASVLAQTVETDVIVMDDCSSDGTPDALRERFPDIRVEASSRSIGCIAQRNRAMELIEAELVVMMDDDAYFSSPRTLEQTLAEFDHPRIAVVTIPYVNARRENFLRLKAPGTAGAYVAGVFVGVGAVFRRSAFRAVGGYERDLVSRGEEADLALRLVGEGHIIRMARSDPLVHWEASPDKEDSAYFHTARNELLLTSLRVPRRYVVWRLAVVVAHSLLRGIRKRRLRSVTRGLVSGCAAAWVRRRERRPAPIWAYKLTRSLRRRGPRPMEEVLSVLSRHTDLR